VDLVLFIEPSAYMSLSLILFHIRRVGIYALEILHYAQLLALIYLLVVLNELRDYLFVGLLLRDLLGDR
jgi:hypothetical protein